MTETGPHANGSSVNGSSSSAPGLDGGAPERFPEPPRSLLTILRTFMDTQQRRVNLWNEYDEAMEGHIKANADTASTNGSQHAEQQTTESVPANDASATSPHEPQSHHEHSANGGCAHTGSGHYQSTPLPLSNPDLMTRIISLVTSGLLDCAHETRAIALELASPTSQTEAGSDQATEAPSDDGTAADRARLSLLVNSVQDCENVVLRSIVQRDQARVRAVRPAGETAPAANGDTADDATLVAELDEKIRDLRQGRIAELMEELRGEMADLELGG